MIRILLTAIILIALGFCARTAAWAQENIPSEIIDQDVTGKIVEADDLQKRVLDYYEEKFGINSIETLGFIEALAWMNMELQDYKEAGSYYIRAVDIRKDKMPVSADNTKNLAVAYFMLADTFLYREYFLEAETYYDKSLSIAIDPAHQGDVFSRKGMIHDGLKNYKKSIEFYLSAVRKYDMAKNRSPQHRQTINKRLLIVYESLIQIYSDIEQHEKVKEYTGLKLLTERLLGIK